jgi:hypothetical protein
MLHGPNVEIARAQAASLTQAQQAEAEQLAEIIRKRTGRDPLPKLTSSPTLAAAAEVGH